ncbi:MAG: hypothetical protein JO100_08690 [Pseudonocardia sp.]|nr:hypothetical protein [Pseudonocardia sp.]
MAAIEVSEDSLRQLTDPGSFERGRTYFGEGRVSAIAIDGAVLTAVVADTSSYPVRLKLTSAGLKGTCSCPHGTEGVFCAHCVAMALAWLDSTGEPGEPSRLSAEDERLGEFLLTQDPAWLVGELLVATHADPLLRARLEVAAGADAREAYDERPLRAWLERVIVVDDDVNYGEASLCLADIDEALDAVAELIDEGFASAAMSLAEHALALLDEAAGWAEDLDEELSETISRAEEIHSNARSVAENDLVTR